MMSSKIYTTVRINNGPAVPGTLIIESQTETVQSNIATKPDMRWEHVDRHGHFHAYDESGQLPTLIPRTRHVDCDGSCGGVCGGEGYDVEDYFCVICDEQIEPGRVDDHEPHLIETGKSWMITARMNKLIAKERVTVRVSTTGEHVAFGVALVGGYEGTFGFDGAEVTVTLWGIGPLGNRKEAISQATS